MRRPWWRSVPLGFFMVMAAAQAQSPEDLLRSAEETYKSPAGYQVSGTANVSLPDSPWQLTANLVIASKQSPPPAAGKTQAPAVPGEMISGFKEVNLGDDKAAKMPGVMFPMQVIGGWERVAENVIAVREIGSEELQFNGAAVPCRVLQVDYKPLEYVPAFGPVTYSICTDKHLILKKTLSYPAGRRSTDAPAKWTLIFNSATFDRSTPAWLAQDMPSLTIRKEWIGRLAPDFTLPDLGGSRIKLSSMRGKLVLLDFWSVTCPPCIHEMPLIEKIGELYKARNVVLWGVSFDEPGRSKTWLLQHQHSLPTLTDQDFSVSDRYKVQGIPSLVLIGRDGKIKNYWEGEVSQQDIEAAIRRDM